MGPKPSTKTTKVSKPEVNRPTVRSRSENKVETKSETNEAKGSKKDDVDDSSVLHPSIDLSISGLRQVLKIFEKGTTEVQGLLSFECDVIYECKVCRNLFRSVANFISHKRIYCTIQYQTSNELLNLNNKLEKHFKSLDPGDAVHPNSVKSKLKNSKYSNTRPNLTAVLKSCVNFSKPMVFNRTNENNFSTNGDYSLHLQSMQDSKAGVFQTYVPSSSESPVLMKYQMQELYRRQEKGGDLETETIESDTWGFSCEENPSEFSNGLSDVESSKLYICNHCGLQCASPKTLLHHKKLIHESARTCYLCPCCKNSFPNTWSVHRHLFKVHHKTNEQVRKLRPQIKSKIVQPGEVTPGMADKMKIGQQKVTDQQKWDIENEEWIEHLRTDLDMLRCGTCGRKFERRAALKSHFQVCQKRQLPVANSTIQYRATPDKETNSTDQKQKMLNDNLKLSQFPVVALTALSPAQIIQNRGIKDTPCPKADVPEKKIGIQVRMDYCKTMTSSTSSHLTDVVSERTNRFSGFSKPNQVIIDKVSPESIKVITIDEDRTIDKPKSCLETLLTAKTNNRSDSGNDSESQDDISVALDFSSDSVADEDAVKLNMYDVIGVNSVDSNADNACDGSLNTESSNCDGYSSDSSVVPNKRKKSYPVKRITYSLDNDLKADCEDRSEDWSEKSSETDCVFRKENAKVTYTNCKLKGCTNESDKIVNSSNTISNQVNSSNSINSSNPIFNEMISKLADYYDQKNGICLLCKSNCDTDNILNHVTEHGNWLKFRCKWARCDKKTFTKAECLKHVVNEHQRVKEKIVAHEFVELISKKDWKFQVLETTNKRSKARVKRPNLLVDSVNKLRKRLNCSTSNLEPSSLEKENISDLEDKTNLLPEKNSPQLVELNTEIVSPVECLSNEIEPKSEESSLPQVCSPQEEKPSENVDAKTEILNHSEELDNDSANEDKLEVVNENNAVEVNDTTPKEEVSNEISLEPETKIAKIAVDEDEEKVNVKNEEKVNASTLDSNCNLPTVDLDEEKVNACISDSIDCKLSTTIYDDDLALDSQCSYADPFTQADKSDMDVELDDDHLRAVMMEMIFGQTNDESAAVPPKELYRETVGSGKKRKFVDREMS